MKEIHSHIPKKLKLLAIIFTVVLVFLTFEIPILINSFLIQFFPEIHPVFNPDEVQAIIDTLRPIGYFVLVILFILIILGFLIKSEKISVTSSFLLFLPTFGNFVMYMFFLAGIGILEFIWLPLDTPFFNFLTLGTIVFIPVYPLSFLSYGPIGIPQWIFMITGLYIFTSGVIIWFYGKHQNKEIIDFSIYKHSRHPQYWGFLIWSYGLFFQYMSLELGIMPMGRIGLEASLPWVIFALVTIGVAFIEDINMLKKYPEKYKEYCKKTPFLIKLPPKLMIVITLPMRVIIKKNFPETKKEALIVVFVYGAIIVILSLPLALLISAYL
ncbi:MAG: methyltransferase family protein [Candidatus Hermodarchaeota archaeon]